MVFCVFFCLHDARGQYLTFSEGFTCCVCVRINGSIR